MILNFLFGAIVFWIARIPVTQKIFLLGPPARYYGVVLMLLAYPQEWLGVEVWIRLSVRANLLLDSTWSYLFDLVWSCLLPGMAAVPFFLLQRKRYPHLEEQGRRLQDAQVAQLRKLVQDKFYKVRKTEPEVVAIEQKSD